MIPVYVNDIKCSLQNKCYFSALSLALTLPDICGRIEYPNKTVGEHYIEWYDKYIGNFLEANQKELADGNPWLSGEVIYNLRNTFLHQGSPTIEGTKVKEVTNQLDTFALILGDDTKLSNFTMNFDIGNGRIIYRAIGIDVTHLCNTICDCALWYYENNKERFEFSINVITQEEMFSTDNFDPTVDYTKELAKNILKLKDNNAVKSPDVKVKQPLQSKPKKVSKEKREAQVRSHFGRRFKAKKYVDRKEIIIQAVVNAKSQNQLEKTLQNYFSVKDVEVIINRFEDLIKNLSK